MTQKADEALKKSFEAVSDRCRRYYDHYKPRLSCIAPSDLQVSDGRTPHKTLWVDSWYGEGHVGDMIVVAKVAPILQAANIDTVFLTNPSFGPLVSSKPGLTAIPYNESDESVRAKLDTATHRATWSYLWQCAKIAHAGALESNGPAIDHSRTQTSELRARYGQTAKPLVGICWRTSLIGRSSERDSHLSKWASLLDNENYDFLSLQYGSPDIIRQELAMAKAERRWNIRQDESIKTIGDLPGYAAQIAACDAVVTIDCTTAYLAAGLGVRTMTLLSTAALETWGIEKACPFFANNSIFRQPEPGCWEHPIRQAADEIRSAFPQNQARFLAKSIVRPSLPDTAHRITP